MLLAVLAFVPPQLPLWKIRCPQRSRICTLHVTVPSQFFFLLKRRLRVTTNGSSSCGRKYPSRGWNMRKWSPWCVLGAGSPSNVFSTYEAPWSPPKLSITKGPRHCSVSFPRSGVESLRCIRSLEVKCCVLTTLSYLIFFQLLAKQNYNIYKR